MNLLNEVTVKNSISNKSKFDLETMDDTDLLFLVKKSLLFDNPFWYDVISRVNIKSDSTLPYPAALLFQFKQLQFEFTWNPKFFKLLLKAELERLKNTTESNYDENFDSTIEKLSNILVHEVLHYCLEHHKRFFSFEKIDVTNLSPDLKNREALKKHIKLHLSQYRFNVSADLPVNQLIGYDKFIDQVTLSNGLKIDMVKHTLFNVPPNLAFEEYYKLFQNKESKEEIDQFVDAVVEVINMMNNQTGNSQPNESSEKSQTESSEECITLIDKSIKDILRDARNANPGNVPGNIQQLIDMLLKQSEIPWQRVLKQFVASQSKARKNFYRTIRNRRYGIYFPGEKRDPILNIALFTDTSGSVSDELHQEFYSEFNAILRVLKVGVTILQCDCNVQNVLENIRVINPEVIKRGGYGGTSLNPPFIYFAEKKKRFDVVVYTTDGQVGFPSIENVKQIVNPNNLLFVVKEGCPEEWKKPPFGRAIILK